MSTSIFRNAGNGNDIEGNARSVFHTALITSDLLEMVGKNEDTDNNNDKSTRMAIMFSRIENHVKQILVTAFTHVAGNKHWFMICTSFRCA